MSSIAIAVAFAAQTKARRFYKIVAMPERLRTTLRKQRSDGWHYLRFSRPG
ncbi:MAG: hypothetical protein H7234_00245 [Herminiimonas sp.]|nr:hypothetical protein [Herminiimonas sp.]